MIHAGNAIIMTKRKVTTNIFEIVRRAFAGSFPERLENMHHPTGTFRK